MSYRPLVRSSDRRAARQRDAWVTFEDRAARRDASSPEAAARPGDQDDRWILSYQRGEIVALEQRVSELERQLGRRSLALAGIVALVVMASAGLLAYDLSKPLPTGEQKPVGAADRVAIAVPSAPVANEPPAPLPTRPESLPATVAAPEPIPPKPATTALGSLPVQAPVHVTVRFPQGDKDAEQLAMVLVRHLREQDLAADDPVLGPPRAIGTGITYYFAEDRDGALAVERILGGLMGSSRLVTRPDGDPMPHPGSVLVTMPAS